MLELVLLLVWWKGVRGDDPDWREPEHGRSARVVTAQPQLLEMQGGVNAS